MKPVITIDPASLDVDRLLAIYDPGELAILYDWLKAPRPASLRNLEHEWQPYAGNSEGSPGPIRLMRSDAGGEALEGALSNAVARPALSGIQGRLPQWAAASESGDIGASHVRQVQRGGSGKMESVRTGKAREVQKRSTPIVDRVRRGVSRRNSRVQNGNPVVSMVAPPVMFRAEHR